MHTPQPITIGSKGHGVTGASSSWPISHATPGQLGLHSQCPPLSYIPGSQPSTRKANLSTCFKEICVFLQGMIWTALSSGCTADQAVSVTQAALPETDVGQCCAEQAQPASRSFSQLQGARNAAVLGGDVILLEASLQSTHLSAQTSNTHKLISGCKSNF